MARFTQEERFCQMIFEQPVRASVPKRGKVTSGNFVVNRRCVGQRNISLTSGAQPAISRFCLLGPVKRIENDRNITQGKAMKILEKFVFTCI